MRLTTRRSGVLDRNYLVHRYLWRDIEMAVSNVKGKLQADRRTVLDIGCGQKPYADLFQDCFYIGLNNSSEDANPDVVGDATNLPVASASVDVVFCAQVLEHVVRPWTLVRESFRILRSGGWLVMSAPFYWPLHEEPHDYFRFTRYGLEQLVKDAGFTSWSIKEDGGDYARFCLSMIQILPRTLGIPLRVPLNVLGVILDKTLHRTALPANYTVVARAPF